MWILERLSADWRTGSISLPHPSWDDFNYFDHCDFHKVNVMCSLYDLSAYRLEYKGAFEFSGQAKLQYASVSLCIIKQSRE